jgi:hypothetical protein
MQINAAEVAKYDFDASEHRQTLAKMMMRLFDHWDLETQDRLELLGLSPASRGLLPKYARGEAGIPKGRDARDRVSYLLAIHKALRLLFPHNEQLRYSWVRRRNEAFGNLRPLDLMREQGVVGLAKVTRFLDAQRGL